MNGFPTSGSVERFFSTNFNSNLINHSGLNRVMSALNFTCATSITRVSVGAKKVFGASWPQIEFWETTLPRPDVYSRILSLTLTNATAAPSPGVFEYIPPKPLPISANNILSLYEPTDSVLKVYSEQDSDMFPPSFYLPRSDGMEQTVLYDNDRPLLSIDTGNVHVHSCPQCAFLLWSTRYFHVTSRVYIPVVPDTALCHMLCMLLLLIN